MFKTIGERMKHYQNSLRNPGMSASNHTGSIENVGFQVQEQPHPGIVQDMASDMALAEERFYAEQYSSGCRIMKSGLIETSADLQNLGVYQMQNELPGVPEAPDPFGWDAQQGYLEPQQQAADAPEPMEPMPHPGMFWPGG